MEQHSRVCVGWSSFRIPFHLFGQFEHVSLFDANIRFVTEAPPPPPLDRPLFMPLLSNIRCDLITKQIIESMQRGEEGDKSSGVIFRGGEIIYKQYHKRLGVRTMGFYLTCSCSIHEPTRRRLQDNGRSNCFPYISPSPALVPAEEHL